jgi:hypothetical protein
VEKLKVLSKSMNQNSRIEENNGTPTGIIGIGRTLLFPHKLL